MNKVDQAGNVSNNNQSEEGFPGLISSVSQSLSSQSLNEAIYFMVVSRAEKLTEDLPACNELQSCKRGAWG